MVIWLVGMSGAGKSVIGRAVYEELAAENPATVLVDGDEIRAVLGHDGRPADYTVDGRRANAERIRNLCAWLDRQGIDVVCCILSIFEESHRWNREHLSDYFEVYVEAPFDVLVDRQPTDLYRRSAAGEVGDVVGIDIPFVPPERPDLVIHNGADPVDRTIAARTIIHAARARASA